MSYDESGGGATEPRRRAARAVSRPALPPGPLKTLKDALHELHAQAGRPTMVELAALVQGLADRLDLEGAPGKDKIHRILTSATVPPEGRDVVAVAAALAHQLNRDVAAVSEQVHQLWVRAATGPSPPARWPMAGGLDPRGHFTSRARGYQGWAHGDDRFRGRREAVAAVRDWLVRPISPGRPLVVLGQPGAGKSAVLGRAVLELELEPAVRGVAVHARDTSLADVTTAIAGAAGIVGSPTAYELLDALNGGGALAVAVDALDEVTDPGERRLIAGLLVDLARLPNVRVAVATRALSGTLPAALGVTGPDAANLVDLDADRWFAMRGLRAFVTAVLQGSPSPYAGNEDLTGRLADAVAERAGRNYLIAALAATHLAGGDTAVDPAAPGFRPEQIPGTVGEAIVKFLDHLPAERRALTRAMLTALAYARGDGIDDDRWVAFAAALGYPVSRLDLDVLRDSPAVDFLLETGTGTRLFHQVLVDEFRGDARRDESAIVRTLTLENCDDYTRRWLPSHAAAAGILDELMSDPGFLLACPPAAVLRHRTALATPEGVAAAQALEAAASEWVARPGDDPRWWLHVWARKTRAGALAVPVADRPWTVAAAFWSGTTHRIITESPRGLVTAVAVWPRADGRSLILTGHRHGRMRLWDPDTGAEAGPAFGDPEGVWSLAVLPRPDGSCLVVSLEAGDHTVRVWDPDTGAQAGTAFDGSAGVLSAVAVLPRPDDRALVVCGGQDGTVTVRDPDTGVQVGPAMTGHTDWVTALAALPRPDGRALLLSAGQDGTVRVWDPDTGAELGLVHHRREVRAVTASADGLRVISGGSDGTVRVWDPLAGVPAGPAMTGHKGRVLAVGELPSRDGGTLIVSGSSDGTVRMWDPRTGTQVGSSLTGHPFDVSSLVVLPRPDGRSSIVTGDDKSVRIWDPEVGIERGPLLAGHSSEVTAVAALPRVSEPDLIVTGSHDGTVRCWDPDTGLPVAAPDRTGQSVWSLAVLPGGAVVTGHSYGTVRVSDATLTGHESPVTSVVVLRGPQPLIASGSRLDCTVRLWDPSTGAPAGPTHTGRKGWVWSMAALARPDGPDLIVTGSRYGMVRAWHPFTRKQVGATLVAHGRAVRGLAALPRPHGPDLIVTAGEDGAVRVWDLDEGTQATPELDAGVGPVTCVAAYLRPGAPAGIVAGYDDGTARLWDPTRPDHPRATLTGHAGAVTAVAALPRPSGDLLIITGGADRTVLVWAPSIGVAATRRLPRPAGSFFPAPRR